MTTALIARAIGPELYGRYTFGLTYILVFSVFSNFGIESLFIREASREKAKVSLINDILPIKVVLSCVTVLAVIVSAQVLEYPSSTKEVIYILCVGLFFQVLYECLMSVYKALEEMYIVALFSILFRIVSAGAIIVSIVSGLGFFGIVSAFAIGNASVFAMALWIHARRWGLGAIRVNARTWISLVVQGYPFFLSALLSMLYGKINVLLLSKMVPETDLGYFMAAANLVDNLFIIPTAFNMTIFPVFSRIYGTSSEALRETYGKMVRYMLILTLGVSAGTVLVGEHVITLLYGDQFVGATYVLQILIFYWALAFFSNVQSSLLFSIHQERIQAKIMMVAFVLSITLNAILIYLYGIIGAACAAVATEAIVVALIAAALWKVNYRWPFESKTMMLVFNVLAMAVIVRLLLPVNLGLAVSMGALTYLLLLFPVGLVDHEDKILLFAWMKKRFAHE